MGLRLKKGDVLFFDTAPFVYFFENNSRYINCLKSLFDEISELDIQIVTSVITYIEICAFPAQKGDQKLVSKYREYFTNSENLSMYPINILIAEQAIKLRSKLNIKTPDAIQLATAHVCGADYIISNDRNWRNIPKIALYLIDDMV